MVLAPEFIDVSSEQIPLTNFGASSCDFESKFGENLEDRFSYDGTHI